MLHVKHRSDDPGSAALLDREAPARARGAGRLRGGAAQTFASLSVPSFRLLWIGMLFTMAAMQMTIVSRAWLAYHLSGSGVVLGVVALARGVPQFCLAPFGGVAADRFDKRTLLIVTQVGLAVLAVTNAVLVELNVITVWQLVVLGIFQGCLYPFMMPTRTAYISDLVDDARLPNALALDSTGRNLNRVLAPTVAGFLIALSPMIAFYAIAVFFTLSVLTLVRLPRPVPRAFRSRGTFADVLVGFRYVRERPTLLMLILMALLFVLLGMPYSQLLPVFQQSVFDVGPTVLGFMYTAVGCGAIVGSLFAAYLADSPHKRAVQIGAGVLFGVGLAAFAVSPRVAEALPFLLVAGMLIEIYFTINRILVVLHTDKQFYGRVISVYSMSWALMPLALLPLGALVDQIGARITVAAAGLALSCVVVGLAALVPGIRHVDEATGARS